MCRGSRAVGLAAGVDALVCQRVTAGVGYNWGQTTVSFPIRIHYN